MPLSFQSSSHGQVAFGFFNIETDMALLNQYFFFAPDFTAMVSDLASHESGPLTGQVPAYILPEAERGNLMGAIHGIDYRGFMGETYRLFPFPADERNFKQNPEGYRNREVVEELIRRHAPLSSMPVTADSQGAWARMGEYEFTRHAFHELVKYVWKGGYPRWKDGVRPAYVLAMKQAVEKSVHPVFGLTLPE